MNLYLKTNEIMSQYTFKSLHLGEINEKGVKCTFATFKGHLRDERSHPSQVSEVEISLSKVHRLIRALVIGWRAASC